MPRGGTNYIPRPDGDFSGFSNHYYVAVKEWWYKQGLDTKDLLPLNDALVLWNKVYADHVAARAAAEGARAAKEEARAALEQLIRPTTNFVQAYTKTTDADRAAIGIAVRDTPRRAAPPPITAPLVRIDSGQRLKHRLRFTDAAAPTSRGKPKGTMGAEVWLALTNPHEPAPPLNPPLPGEAGPYKFLSVNSRGDLQTDFPSSEAGKTAYYALRWVSTRGEKGPWSEVCSATVAA